MSAQLNPTREDWKKMETYIPTLKPTKGTTDMDAVAINALVNDVQRMADTGDHLRRVFARLKHNRSFMRQWIVKNCDFSVSSGLRYMIMAAERQELRRAGIRVLADAYSLLGLDSNVSIGLSSPLWDRAISDRDAQPVQEP
ncbi:hypothetical protein [Desulfuromonas sp. CSMB_57]|uniref:hypothetical protein n=1 Tax=Desulfuromonas sp. CSMB_57 TaxID=2807629 RepID=UPI001CD5D77E|nr:hypothetical protein [Desulfuromonas sp. CSMB_57]